ncbi:MAG: hypothetical protein ACI8Y4_001498 [Candidatus Poriferisodalaceae bacterium]|jgi:hypothetical protein
MAEPTDTPSLDSNSDWGQQAASTFLDLVDNVKTKATGPAIKVVRLVAYGLVLLVAALMLFVLLIAGLVRLLDILVPGNVWSAHLIIGGIFLVAGMLLWSKRRP